MAVEMTEAPLGVPNYNLPQSDGGVAIGEIVELFESANSVSIENEVYIKTGNAITTTSYAQAPRTKNTTLSGSTFFSVTGLELISTNGDNVLFGLKNGIRIVGLDIEDGGLLYDWSLVPRVGREWVGMAANENYLVLIDDVGSIIWRTLSGGFVNQYDFGPTNFDEVYGIALSPASDTYILCKPAGHTEISIRVISSNFAQMGFIQLRQIQSTIFGISCNENELYVYGLPTNQVPKVFSLRLDGDWQSPTYRTEIFHSVADYPVFKDGDLHMSSSSRVYPLVDVVGTVREITSNHASTNNYVRVQ